MLVRFGKKRLLMVFEATVSDPLRAPCTIGRHGGRGRRETHGGRRGQGLGVRMVRMAWMVWSWMVWMVFGVGGCGRNLGHGRRTAWTCWKLINFDKPRFFLDKRMMN